LASGFNASYAQAGSLPAPVFPAKPGGCLFSKQFCPVFHHLGVHFSSKNEHLTKNA
jgi:hypothetical protein